MDGAGLIWFFVGPQIYLETNNCLSIEENEYDDKIMNKLCRVVICLAIHDCIYQIRYASIHVYDADVK